MYVWHDESEVSCTTLRTRLEILFADYELLTKDVDASGTEQVRSKSMTGLATGYVPALTGVAIPHTDQ